MDTSTDFRQQALRSKIKKVDAVLYTHPHADHILGIDEMRAFNFSQKSSIPVYGNSWTCEELKLRFSYIFDKKNQVIGGGIPKLELHHVDGKAQSFSAAGIEITPIAVEHGPNETLGYRIASVAYVTDCSYIAPESLDRMRNLQVLVLDCLRLEEHPTHLNLKRALEVISEVKPARTVLTHLGHDFDYSLWKRKLPKGVSLAYDTLKINVPS